MQTKRALLMGVWTHVAATYDGSAMRLYQDGREVGRVAKTGLIDTNPAVPVWIGDNPPTAGSRPFHGWLRDIRIYRRALSEAEVHALAEQPEPAVNLVQDPGFENQSDTSGSPLVAPWFVTNLSGAKVGIELSEDAHGGRKVAFIYQPGTNNSFTDVHQTVTVAANTHYTLRGWFANEHFADGEFGVRTSGGTVVTRMAIPKIGPARAYQQLILTFNSGSNASLVIFAGYRPVKGSWIHMDDISLELAR